MPRRTVIFKQLPWNGGVNTAVDAGVLPTNDLVQADNVVFASSGSRLKREGFDKLDSAIPAITHRSSSGTTRTLVFASAVSSASNNIIHVGEKLIITGAGNANYNTTAAIVASVTTTTVTNDTITYTFSGAASFNETSTADSGATAARNYLIIKTHDYWYYDSGNNVKQQELIAVSSQGFFYTYDENGNRLLIPKSASGATSLALTTISKADMRTFGNRCIITLEGVNNTPKYYDAMAALEWKDLPNAPDAEFMQEHLGRLWMNDKEDKDFLHFCETFDETKWKGTGDSGALYIGIEDGDPVGLSAIYPPFKGQMVLGKGERVLKLVGDAPENFQIVPMTNGLGAASHLGCVAIDFDDVFYVSRRGFHSVIASDTTADFEGTFLSAKIQPTFNTWNKQKLELVQGVYLESINSAAWIVSEDGTTQPNAIWLYNPTINQGEWYRWPDLNAQSIGKKLVSGRTRVVIGKNDGTVWLGQNSLFNDPNNTSITYRIKTGTIYPDGDPQTIKGFKRFGLLFRPTGRVSFTAYFKVDGFPAQSLSFTQSLDGDELGTDFVLGSSRLGQLQRLAPYMKQVVGYGRGCEIELFQTGTDAQVEIYGYMIEFESADVADEVKE
jgi:hypothetical protein